MNALLSADVRQLFAERKYTESDVLARVANQQPAWQDHPDLGAAKRFLQLADPLVSGIEIAEAQHDLAAVAAGQALIVQAGDCAEDPAESTEVHVHRKVGMLRCLAGILNYDSNVPVVRLGRLGGQFAKPRSAPSEFHADVELPAYRGHLVNDPAPTLEARSPDPQRLLKGYRAARAVSELLRDIAAGSMDERIWMSHEALILDYEIPQVRHDPTVGAYLSSAHVPWIGNRTNEPDGAHVELLASVVNPVACKVGPDMSVQKLLALCQRLDPHREPGRLTLISRMGAAQIAHRLTPLMRAVAEAGHPVIWLCDPMHGNTVKTAAGSKVRYLDTVQAEVIGFRDSCRAVGVWAGGLHLETTPDDVLECAAAEHHTPGAGTRYTSLCDPRLNLNQAISVVSSFGRYAHG
jgi:3-deoxy-7-phosphoheptulonate synthase